MVILERRCGREVESNDKLFLYISSLVLSYMVSLEFEIGGDVGTAISILRIKDEDG